MMVTDVNHILKSDQIHCNQFSAMYDPCSPLLCEFCEAKIGTMDKERLKRGIREWCLWVNEWKRLAKQWATSLLCNQSSEFVFCGHCATEIEDCGILALFCPLHNLLCLETRRNLHIRLFVGYFQATTSASNNPNGSYCSTGVDYSRADTWNSQSSSVSAIWRN